MALSKSSFWLAAAVFQLAFGGLVFALTRAYYLPANDADARQPAGMPVASTQARQWGLGIDDTTLGRLTDGLSMPQEPAELWRLANEAFAAGDYPRAVGYYERLLAIEPANPDVRNNLGLTWHYVGRTDEALGLLEETITAAPDHQRSWLTLGFVNRQAGDVEAARKALQTAVGIDAGSEVGQSAQRMLDEL